MSTKTCIGCGQEKHLDNFWKENRPGRGDGYWGRCKACKAEDARNRRRSPETRQKVRAAERRYYERVRGVVWEWKKGPCADCGVEYPPYVMQFDHVPGRGEKLFQLTPHASRNHSNQDLVAEREKCDLVCANCHAIRTHSRRPVDWVDNAEE